MACFVVPMAEAIVVSIAKNIIDKKQRKSVSENSKSEEGINSGFDWSQKLGWLNNLLWGGVFLLALEHIWHGEVILWPPFLTAMKNPSDIAPMLHEMALFGTSMAIVVTIVWGIMVFVTEYKWKSIHKKVYTED